MKFSSKFLHGGLVVYYSLTTEQNSYACKLSGRKREQLGERVV